jgi:hypothetical protein
MFAKIKAEQAAKQPPKQSLWRTFKADVADLFGMTRQNQKNLKL